MMRYFELTLSTAVDNLLLEAEAGRGGEVLRLWECREKNAIAEGKPRVSGTPFGARPGRTGQLLLSRS